MFPWLWIFAPTAYWPLSGAVTQDVSTEAFFRGIRPGAGVAPIEKRIFEEASYGKQLGWLIDVLLDAIGPEDVRTADARQALESLRVLQAEIAHIKRDHRQDQTGAAVALLDRLQAEDPAGLRRVLARYDRQRQLT